MLKDAKNSRNLVKLNVAKSERADALKQPMSALSNRIKSIHNTPTKPMTVNHKVPSKPKPK